MYFCFFAASELRLFRETAVLTTLQVCVFPSSFKDRLLWLHIAISVSAFLSSVTPSVPLVLPFCGWGEANWEQGFPIVSPNSIFGVNVEWMSLWHDRASLTRYETWHCVDTLVQQVVHTAGEETVNQEAVQDTFHSGNVYAQAQPRIQPCMVRKGKCLILNRLSWEKLEKKTGGIYIYWKFVEKKWIKFGVPLTGLSKKGEKYDKFREWN